MKKGIGYLRVSTDGQAQNGFGLGTQREQIAKYARDNDYEIIEWLSDDGVSGASEDRPAFDQIVYGDVNNPPVEAVIVAKSDRVARDINLYFYYKYMLTKKGIRLVSVSEDFGQLGMFASVLEAFTATMAQMERDNITRRTSSGRNQKARQGGFAGGRAPFGYETTGGSLQVNDREAAAVIRIFEMRDRGLTYRKIADILTHEGHTSRIGTPITFGGVSNIVKNRPFYEGLYKYGDMAEWVEGQHEPILKG